MKNAKNCLKKPNFSACKHNKFLKILYAFNAIFAFFFDETIEFYVCGILKEL